MPNPWFTPGGFWYVPEEQQQKDDASANAAAAKSMSDSPKSLFGSVISSLKNAAARIQEPLIPTWDFNSSTGELTTKLRTPTEIGQAGLEANVRRSERLGNLDLERQARQDYFASLTPGEQQNINLGTLEGSASAGPVPIGEGISSAIRSTELPGSKKFGNIAGEIAQTAGNIATYGALQGLSGNNSGSTGLGETAMAALNQGPGVLAPKAFGSLAAAITGQSLYSGSSLPGAKNPLAQMLVGGTTGVLTHKAPGIIKNLGEGGPVLGAVEGAGEQLPKGTKVILNDGSVGEIKSFKANTNEYMVQSTEYKTPRPRTSDSIQHVFTQEEIDAGLPEQYQALQSKAQAAGINVSKVMQTGKPVTPEGATFELPKMAPKNINEARTNLQNAQERLFNIQEQGDVDPAILKNAQDDVAVALHDYRSAKSTPVTDTVSRGAWDTVKDILNLPMTLVASSDISGAGRQGLKLGLANPKQYLPALKNQFGYFKSQDNFDSLMNNIQSHPLYPLLQKAGVFLNDFSKGQREERLSSALADKLPWIKGSERAYAGVLNDLRANVFYKEAQNAIDRGRPLTDIELRQLGDEINHASGRGTGSFLNWAGAAEVSPFFSIRYRASTPQLIADMFTKSGPARTQAIKSMLGLGAVVAGIDALGTLTGVGGVNANPLASGFGKLRVGSTSYDISGGALRDVSTAAKAGVGLAQTVTGDKTIGGSQQDNPLSTLGRYARGSLSPTFALATDLLKGKDFLDRPIDYTALTGNASIGAELSNLVVPLALRDIVNAGQQDFGKNFGPKDAANFLASVVGSVFGAGVQTYQTNAEQIDSAMQAAGKDPTDLIARKDFITQNPEYRTPGKSTDVVNQTQQARQTLENNVTSDPTMTLTKFREQRKSVLQRQRDQLDVLLGDTTTPKSGQQGKWLQEYNQIFKDHTVNGQLDNNVDSAIADWANNNPGALNFINAYTSAGLGPVETSYLNDMRTLDAAGYFPGHPNSVSRYQGMRSGLSDKEITALKDRVDTYRANPAHFNEPMAVSVQKALADQPQNVQVDVFNSYKDAYKSRAFQALEQEYQKQLLWFSDANWDAYKNYVPGNKKRTGGSLPTLPSLPALPTH